MEADSPTEQPVAQAAPLSSFFSAMHLRRLQKMHDSEHDPSAEPYKGAFLFIDMVAFTSLGERLSKQGVKGAEVLSAVLHDYYVPILATIQQHGGDVLFFGGDALGIVWLADDAAEAGLRAAQCALAIQAMIPNVRSVLDAPLAFRASLGIGAMEALVVGGLDASWLHLVRGEAIEQACQADRHSAGGAVAISEASAKWLEPSAPVFSPLADGFLRIERIGHETAPAPLAIPEIAAGHALSLGAGLNEAVNRLLHAPAGVAASEFRRTTVLFCDISGTDLTHLHHAVCHAQQEALRFDGIVYHLVEDDKGTGLIIVFGLPGNTHADDQMRALLLAKRLGANFAALGIAPRIGISTGTAFCGPLGSDYRQHYSVIGSSINLAARLMAMAHPGQVLCDNHTRKLANEGFGFQEAGWTHLKGFADPVQIFEPGEQRAPDETRSAETEIVGRDREIAEVVALATAPAGSDLSKLIVIRADAGVGKSLFLQKLRTILADKGIHAVRGNTDAFETETAYFAFRDIARHWCGLEKNTAAEPALLHLQAQLQDMPDLLPLAPLLGQVLGFDFPETDLTRALRGQLRSDNTRRVLLHLAKRSFERDPAVLLIEDAHWMDGASWSFLEHLLTNLPSLLVLMSTRPKMEKASDGARVVEGPWAHIVELRPITRPQTEELIRAQLSVSDVSAAALDLVFDRAEGNPLFIKEIVNALLETGDLQVAKSRVDLRAHELGEIAVPDTLNGVITSRIDRLPTELQITIKAAAVLGRTFDTDLLHAVHPLHTDVEKLSKQLEQLEENGFLVGTGGHQDYTFHHALTRDAAYNLLSFAQRETLHHEAALALEAKYAGRTDQVNARLGYHFRMAGVRDKAALHLAAAGATALDAYASRDAVELLTTALTLDEEFRGAITEPDFARTYWCRMIGQAHYNLDDQPEAANWYRRAIKEAGVAPRMRVLGILPTLMRAIFRPETLDRPPSPKLTEKDRERIAHGLGSASELGIIYLWESALGRFALNAVNQVRIARIVGPTEETASAIATMAFLMSSAGLHRKSEKVVQQAVRMATDYDHIGQIVSTHVMAGMVFTQNGAPALGLPYFEAADNNSSDLISGVWRHRSKFMLADAVMWLGQYTRAHDLFLDTAKLSHNAEPHTAALATALASLSLLRMGRPEQAVELLQGPDGVAYARECGVPTTAIASLGVLAEARLALGNKQAALSAASEAEAQATAKDDGTGYYSGLFGYGSILSVRTQTGDLGADAKRGGDAARQDLRKIAKITMVAPLGKASLRLWKAMYALQSGKTAKAKRLLERAVIAATQAQQPFERGRSIVELAKLSEGEQKNQLLQQAAEIFETHKMPLELALARAHVQH